jgi:hypothetical protein
VHENFLWISFVDDKSKGIVGKQYRVLTLSSSNKEKSNDRKLAGQATQRGGQASGKILYCQREVLDLRSLGQMSRQNFLQNKSPRSVGDIPLLQQSAARLAL